MWEAVSAGKLDFNPFISQINPSSPFCNGSGPCSLAVLSWGGIGQDRLGISQVHCAMQDRPLHPGSHLLSVEVASPKLVIFNQSSSAEVPWVTEAQQGGRLARISRALCCHQRGVASAAPSLPEVLTIREGVPLPLDRRTVPEAEQHLWALGGLLVGWSCEAAHF